MNRIKRGTFLRAGAAAAATLNFLYPGLTRAAGTVRRETRSLPTTTRPPAGVVVMDGPDPTFAGGQVVTKTADGVVLQSHAAVRTVRIPPGTVAWKEFDVTPDVIQLGDWVDVKGTPLADGSLQARSGWVFVNIGRRDGVVGQVVSPTSLNVRNGQSTYTMELSSRLEVIGAEDGLPLPGGLASLTPGTQFGAVGLRLPNYGFRATRIWI
jgi:hypothetical protein